MPYKGKGVTLQITIKLQTVCKYLDTAILRQNKDNKLHLELPCMHAGNVLNLVQISY